MPLLRNIIKYCFRFPLCAHQRWCHSCSRFIIGFYELLPIHFKIKMFSIQKKKWSLKKNEKPRDLLCILLERVHLSNLFRSQCRTRKQQTTKKRVCRSLVVCVLNPIRTDNNALEHTCLTSFQWKAKKENIERISNGVCYSTSL